MPGVMIAVTWYSLPMSRLRVRKIIYPQMNANERKFSINMETSHGEVWYRYDMKLIAESISVFCVHLRTETTKRKWQ
jgi:hypothetical protein